MSTAAPLPAGVRLQGYEIERLLSADGSFGLVYVASDLDHRRIGRRREALSKRWEAWRRPDASTNLAKGANVEPSAGPRVVIKEFFPKELAERAFDGRTVAARTNKGRLYDWSRARFVDEAKFLLGHSHPHVVSVFDIVSTHNTDYMVMELLTGGSLMDVVSSRGGRSEDELRQWLLPLLRALQSIEAHGVDHLDLSPSNIVFRASGGDPVLLDFGAARMRGPQRSRNTRLIVNDGYSAPEKYRATSQGLDSRADIYALGGILNFALTGERPHPAMERIAEAEKARGLTRQGVAQRTRHASPKFLAAVDACFSLAASDRPRNAAEAERLFGPWGLQILPPPDISITLDSAPVRRRGAQVAFLALLLLLLGLLLVAPALAAPSDETATPHETRR